MKYSIAKGVFDILPKSCSPDSEWKQSENWQYLKTVILSLVKTYGFSEIVTPIFEKTDLFKRSIGSETDIVSKEMYTFDDKANRSMTLRPEGTAPVMRAYIEKQLHNQLPIHKLFYIGPMFRYERQQAGRYRQFYQLGIEAIGSSSHLQDVEVIDLAHSLFQQLGIKNVTLYLNSIGSRECRKKYRQALIDFLKPHQDKLSTESQKRLEVNPLRILDSKNGDDQEVLKNAPSILDHLSPECLEHFEKVQEKLKLLNIPFTIHPGLVRGLDYYNQTVFEFVSGNLGAHDTLCAGGRYDYLVEDLGGPKTPAVGFALGFERLLQVMLNQECAFSFKTTPHLLLLPMGDVAQEIAFKLLKQLRHNEIETEMDFENKKLKQTLKYAHKKEIPFVAILGDEELKNNQIKLKNMISGDEESIPIDKLILTLKNEK